MENKNANNFINKDSNSDLDKVLYNNIGVLSKDNQKILLTSYSEQKNKGKFDELFGTKKVATYISFVICLILFIIGMGITVFEILTNKEVGYEIWDRIFPIVTLILGYIFGKNPNNDKN